MKSFKKFPKNFFEKNRPNINSAKTHNDKIIPIEWSNEVLEGKYKDKELITIKNRKCR